MLKELGVNPKLCRNCEFALWRKVRKLTISFYPVAGENMFNERQLTEFVVGWQERLTAQPTYQTLQEITSLHAETSGISDPYYFTPRDGKLYPPGSDRPVEEYVDQESHLGRIELKPLIALTTWANNEQQGTAVWISPPHPERSTKTKIIASTLVDKDGTKQVLNRTILASLGESAYFALANDYINHSVNPGEVIENSETLRGKLTILTAATDWLDIAQKYIDNPVLFTQIRSDADLLEKGESMGRAREYYQLFQKGLAPSEIVDRMRKDNFLGIQDSSCPPTMIVPTASEFMAMGSLVYSADAKTLDCTCPFCSRRVKAIISAGKIRCPDCNQSANYKC